MVRNQDLLELEVLVLSWNLFLVVLRQERVHQGLGVLGRHRVHGRMQRLTGGLAVVLREPRVRDGSLGALRSDRGERVPQGPHPRLLPWPLPVAGVHPPRRQRTGRGEERIWVLEHELLEAVEDPPLRRLGEGALAA